MLEEVWKPIKGFENKYKVSNKGRIKNIKTGHIYKMTNQYGDYFSIILYDENHKKSTRIHREVAKAFIPNPNNFPEVNHKDGNKQNNCVENLEWCTRKYNQVHALKTGLNTMKHLNKINKNKFVKKYGRLIQCDMQGNVLNVFENLEQAHQKTGVCKRNILQVINQQEGRKQAGGFIKKKKKEVIKNAL